MSLWDTIASGVSSFNPIEWAKDEFTRGQARDEARTVRAEDRADQRRNESNQNSIAMASIKAGGQGSIGSTIPVGQSVQTPELSRGQNFKGASERQADQLSLDILREQKEGLRLDNLAKSQKLEKPPVGTPEAGSNFLPGGGQVIKGGVVEKPLERTISHPGSPHMEHGAVAGQGFEVTPTGLAPIPSGDVKQRTEDSLYELRNFYRYGIRPNFNDYSTRPPDSLLRPGNMWDWSFKNQEWVVVPLPDDSVDNVRSFSKNFPRLGKMRNWLYGNPKGGK